ncbi:pectinesterase family protein [Viridibacterium curvum]|uniref:Pectinesterase n=1 Tax=Viridibacterium curvum TaxID=1101404 RepID=A0ABP9QR05_9RHOO
MNAFRPFRMSRNLLAAVCATFATVASLPATAATSTSTRPQLTSTTAASYTIAKYMAQAGTIGSLTTDNWDPTGGVGTSSSFTANYTVASDGTASYKTIQAAISAAVAAGGTTRKYISVKAGTYREVVCVPASAPPITLYGISTTASDTTLVYNNANLTPKSTGTVTNGCVSNSSATTVGTLNSATLTVLAKYFRVINLTISNDYAEGTYSGSNQSALALAQRGDQGMYQNVRLLGNQDTVYVGSTSYSTVIRAYFRSSFIKGDTDFVFGHGTAVFHGCTIQYSAARLGAGVASYIFAPSTVAANSYGFLVISSTINSTGSASTGTIYLGRAWDEGVSSVSSYVNGSSPNGQLVIRDTAIDSFIRSSAPWGTSTAGRPYCSSSCTYSANRFNEYNNSGY